jgi:hypothetical protein
LPHWDAAALKSLGLRSTTEKSLDNAGARPKRAASERD